MSQFMFNPTGAPFGNTMDPLSNLDALERRKREMAQAQAEFDAARARARAKREAEEAARRPASVEAPASAPTAPAAAAPAAKPNASTSASAAEPDKYSLLRKAAQDRYQAELSRMADISTSGGVVPPLSSKRAGQRYENELNRLAAIQAMERDRAARREALVSRVNERKAAQSARRAQIAADRKRQADEASQAGIAAARDIIQAGQSVNPAALQERQFLDRLMEGALAPRTPTTNPLRAALAQTPTGRLMDLATSPVEQFGPGAEPGEPLRTREAYDVADPVFGDPTYMGPTSLPPVQASQQQPQAPAPTAPRAAQAPRPLNQLEQAIEEMKRNPQPRAPLPMEPTSLGTLPRDPLLEQAGATVSKRYEAMGVNPMDPAVYPQYSREVQRELQNLRPMQMSAPVQLPAGESRGFLGSLADSIIGPGGLLGAPIPPELAQRAVDMAPTEAARQEALVQQLRAEQQGALLDALAGGAAGLRGPSAAAPSTRPGTVDVNYRPGLKPQVKLNPDGSPTIVFPTPETGPGSPRFVSRAEDAPNTVVPGVRPRDLPSSAGQAQERPLVRPTKPAPRVEPSASQGQKPVPPQTRQQKSDARLRELERLNRAADTRNAQQDAVNRIIDALAEAGILPNTRQDSIDSMIDALSQAGLLPDVGPAVVGNQ